MAAQALTDPEWEVLLIDGSARGRPPPIGSPCDASRYGCEAAARGIVVGPRLALCRAHIRDLEDQADHLGLRLHESVWPFAVVYGDEHGDSNLLRGPPAGAVPEPPTRA